MRSILLTNDDGVDAQGLRAVWETLKGTTDLFVAAPATNQSGTGASNTLTAPLFATQLNWGDDTPVYKIKGTPCDCVQLAVSALLPERPDLVIAGINHGENSGRTIFNSGTASAAACAALRGIPAIALSTFELFNPNFTAAVNLIPDLIRFITEHPLPPDCYLNVNIPSSDEIRGIRLTTQGRRFWSEKPELRRHEVLGPYYWLGFHQEIVPENPNSDVMLLQQGFAVATPIRVADLHHADYVDDKQKDFQEFFSEEAALL